MNKKIIIIQGYLASGKSTFALKLAKELNVPYLIKDTFKSAICKSITIGDRNISSQFSAATFDAMLYVTERLFETGSPIIIEGNFMPAGVKAVDEAGEIRRMIEEYGYSPLTFKFRGDAEVLHRRFVEREQTAERGQANKVGGEVAPETFSLWCRNLDGFDVGGQMMEVDTTDFGRVDFEGLVSCARRFMER